MKTLGSTYYIFPFMFTYKGWRVTVYKVRHYGIRYFKVKVVFELSAESLAADCALRNTSEAYLSSYRRCLELAESFMQGRKKRIEKKYGFRLLVYGRWGYLTYFIFLRDVEEIYVRSPTVFFTMANETRQKAVAYINDYLGDVQSQWFRFLEEHTTWEQ